MKNKKCVKKVIVGIVITIVIILGLIFFTAFKELQEEDILKQEIVNYSNKDLATDDYSIKVKTTGDRAYVDRGQVGGLRAARLRRRRKAGALGRQDSGAP